MDDILVTRRLGPHRTICLSTLTRNQLVASSPEYVGDDFGYFLYEVDHSRSGGIIVLARVLSLEAALRILNIAETAFGLTPDPLQGEVYQPASRHGLRPISKRPASSANASGKPRRAVASV